MSEIEPTHYKTKSNEPCCQSCFHQTRAARTQSEEWKKSAAAQHKSTPAGVQRALNKVKQGFKSLERQVLDEVANDLEERVGAAVDPRKEMVRCGLDNWQLDSRCSSCHCCERDFGYVTNVGITSGISHCRFCGFISGTNCCLPPNQMLLHPKTKKPEKACVKCVYEWQAALLTPNAAIVNPQKRILSPKPYPQPSNNPLTLE